MAKEYYSVKTQRIEFDTEKLTMTVTMHDDKFSVVSVQKLNENEFNSQYYMFKSQVFKGMSLQNQNPMGLTTEDAQRIEHTPTSSSLESFNEIKSLALSVISNVIE